jgi:PAS domain S-box-containing protein
MSSNRVALLLSRTADAGFAVNREGMIRAWNRSAEQLFGYSAAQAMNMPCVDLISFHTGTHADTCCKHCGVIGQCLAGTTVPNYDVRAKTAAGTPIWINVSILAYQDEVNNELLVVHFARDITRQKDAENLNQQLIDLVRQIVQLPQAEQRRPPIVPLTDQEHRILRDISDGKHPRTVARERQITLGTLRNHLHRVNQKLGTCNRLEAVIEAKRRGVI